MHRIRPAGEADLPVLREIERAAGAPFAEIGMIAVAEDEPPSLAHLREFVTAGRAWVLVDARDRPIAYLVLAIVDGHAHIEQVSVHPDHAGHRFGARLIDHAAAWARSHAMTALSLTTFTEVPWNGPYYARLGFRVVPVSELTPGLRGIRSAEAAHGLDDWPRAVMRRDLGEGPSAGGVGSDPDPDSAP